MNYSIECIPQLRKMRMHICVSVHVCAGRGRTCLWVFMGAQACIYLFESGGIPQ